MSESNSDVIKLAIDLLARPSVTPEDAGCQQLMKERLSKLGFINETMVFEDTTNLWSRRDGNKNVSVNNEPVFCFAGHTDVVPAGNLALWHTPPFEPTIIDGMLYGRGAADMKGSLAAMIIATERFVNDFPSYHGAITYLITSDEEGAFINGTTRVIDTLEARNEKITYCIVGEPSSTSKVGDVITISNRERNGNVLICIEDTGVGCRKDYTEQIFQLGFTTKKEGTGFGLHDCANFIRMNNGEVTFTSEGQGKGGKVQISLPIHTEVNQVAS